MNMAYIRWRYQWSGFDVKTSQCVLCARMENNKSLHQS